MLSVKGSCVIWETGVSGRTTKSPRFNIQNRSYSFRFISLGHCENFLLIFHSEPVDKLAEFFEVTVMLKFNTDNQYYGIGSYLKLQTDSKIIWKFTFDNVVRNPEYKMGLNYLCVKVILYCQRPGQSINKEIGDLNEIESNIPPDLESLSDDFGDLLKDKTFTDAKLKCRDHIIPAHRCVLAARSQVFAAMFRNDMNESKTGVVDITDLDADVVDTFLQYLYKGQVSEVPDAVMPCLYVAADKYGVSDLKDSCRDWMIRNLAVTNCIKFLILADEHSDTVFKKAVICLICYRKEVLKSDAWKEFSKQFPNLAIEVFQNYVEHPK